MPTYDYVCAACAHTFEQFQEMSAKKLKTCPRCHKPRLERQVGAGAGLIFKGSGFYITDYRKSPPPSEGAAPSGDASSSKQPSKEASKDASKESSKETSKGGTQETSKGGAGGRDQQPSAPTPAPGPAPAPSTASTSRPTPRESRPGSSGRSAKRG